MCECTDQCSEECLGWVNTNKINITLALIKKTQKPGPEKESQYDHSQQRKPGSERESIIANDKLRIEDKDDVHEYSDCFDKKTMAKDQELQTANIKEDAQTTDPSQTNAQSCLLSITQIHNRRNNTTIVQDVLDQVETRYWYPGHTKMIQGIQYVNDLKKETFRTFTHNFKVTRTVVSLDAKGSKA